MTQRRSRRGYRYFSISDAVTHGKVGTYNVYGCRCDVCRRGWADYSAEQRRNRVAKGPGPSQPHGSPSTYANWGCRCDKCKAAWSKEMKAQAARRKIRQDAK